MKIQSEDFKMLTGIIDEDFYKAQKVNNNTQLYKQDVLEGIFKQML